MVPVAELVIGVWRRHIGCNGPYLEHDDRSSVTFVGDTIAGYFDPMVAAPKGVPVYARVPYECGNGS